MIREKAHGKINLTLDVLGKRYDGYHQVEMVMQQIELHDQVELVLRDDHKIAVTCNMPGVPLGEKNLAYRAGLLMKEEFDLTRGFNIHLEKVLPMEAGLAGGSSNGAAVLRGLNTLFNLGCSTEKLMKLATGLGADMPFCVMGGTALAEGLGELLTPLDSKDKMSLILIKPPFGANTGEVYGSLDLNKISNRPDTVGMIQALAQGNEQAVIETMGNVLEEVTIKLYPEIQQIKDELSQFGIPALMTGSGTTVFGIIPTGEKNAAKKAGSYFEKKLGYEVFFTTTL